MYEHDALKV